MEYTDYWVAKGTAGEVREALEGVVEKAILIDDLKGFVPFAAVGTEKKIVKAFDWILSVFDAEGAAWGFTICMDGKQVATATYGDNAEWGISRKDNGFEGDMAEAAKALGISEKKLKGCLDDEGAVKLCKAIGFNHQYMLYPHEDEMPPGVVLMSDLM